MNTPIKILLALLALSQLPQLFDEPAAPHAATPEEARQQLASIFSPSMQAVLAQNACTDAVLARIETGRWDDAWCASHYAHLVHP